MVATSQRKEQMEPKKKSSVNFMLAVAVLLFALFIALHMAVVYGEAPAGAGGNVDFGAVLRGTTRRVEDAPFAFEVNEHSPGFAAAAAGAVFLIVIYALASRGKYIRGKEYGTASWGSASEIKGLFADNIARGLIRKERLRVFSRPSARRAKIRAIRKKYRDADMILTATERTSIYNFQINNNTLIIGGSGSGKTRSYVMPNILQAHSSYVITDPKGEILEKSGKFLESRGYGIRALNLDELSRSCGYNPFAYVHMEREGWEERILSLIETLIENTKGEDAGGGSDPFWPMAERLFLQAMFFFTARGFPPDECNMNTVMDLIAMLELPEDEDMRDSDLDFFAGCFAEDYGADMDELEANCKTLRGVAGMYSCQLRTLNYQQEKGFRLTLPLGYSPAHLSVEMALTTESTAVFMPFNNMELMQSGGFYYGLNQVSKNLILCDRTAMKTPSGFILGTAGSGKSFATKREILNVILKDGTTWVIIIDPENEYGDFLKTFGGEVIKISADSLNYINPMDMPPDYGLDEDDGDETPLDIKKSKAIRKKSDFIMSLIEKMISQDEHGDAGGVTPQQKTIIDRCVKRCYKDYLAHDFDTSLTPTLSDLQTEFEHEKDGSAAAALIADAVEYYTRGSMDIFAHLTNVDTASRLVVFNIRDLGEQLRPIGQMIMFDFIWNRMVANKARGIRTYCYCDEIHTMFASYNSAYFLRQLYKRGRKYGLVITGVTQNIEELLRSDMARGMIGNSDFLLMLNQSPEDLKILAAMLNISPAQMDYLKNSPPGSGLLRAQGTIVPFVDEFPPESYLYGLMSTNFNEVAQKEKRAGDGKA